MTTGGTLSDRLGNFDVVGFPVSSDTFDGAEGRDFIIGDGGADTYSWSAGDGRDIIADNSSDNTLNIFGASSYTIHYSGPSTLFVFLDASGIEIGEIRVLQNRNLFLSTFEPIALSIAGQNSYITVDLRVHPEIMMRREVVRCAAS